MWLLVLLPLTARATPVLHASSSRLSPGETLVIEWSRLPAGTHEVEFEVSLDGGRWLRISPELEPHEHRFAWTVPIGLSGQARIRLRYGREHEEHEGGMLELEIGAGAAVAGPGPGRAAGEWWSLGGSNAIPADARLTDAPSLSPWVTPLRALPNDPDASALPLVPVATCSRASGPVHHPPASAGVFTPPRNTPLRN